MALIGVCVKGKSPPYQDQTDQEHYGGTDTATIHNDENRE